MARIPCVISVVSGFKCQSNCGVGVLCSAQKLGALGPNWIRGMNVCHSSFQIPELIVPRESLPCYLRISNPPKLDVWYGCVSSRAFKSPRLEAWHQCVSFPACHSEQAAGWESLGGVPSFEVSGQLGCACMVHSSEAFEFRTNFGSRHDGVSFLGFRVRIRLRESSVLSHVLESRPNSKAWGCVSSRVHSEQITCVLLRVLRRFFLSRLCYRILHFGCRCIFDVIVACFDFDVCFNCQRFTVGSCCCTSCVRIGVIF